MMNKVEILVNGKIIRDQEKLKTDLLDERDRVIEPLKKKLMEVSEEIDRIGSPFMARVTMIKADISELRRKVAEEWGESEKTLNDENIMVQLRTTTEVKIENEARKRDVILKLLDLGRIEAIEIDLSNKDVKELTRMGILIGTALDVKKSIVLKDLGGTK